MQDLRGTEIVQYIDLSTMERTCAHEHGPGPIDLHINFQWGYGGFNVSYTDPSWLCLCLASGKMAKQVFPCCMLLQEARLHAVPALLVLVSLMTRIPIRPGYTAIGDMNLDGGVIRANKPTPGDFIVAHNNKITHMVVPKASADVYDAMTGLDRRGITVSRGLLGGVGLC